MAGDGVRGLLLHELRDIYGADTLLLKALPRMARGATHPDLREVLRTHVRETEAQLDRLDAISSAFGVNPRGQRSLAMEGLIDQGADVLITRGGSRMVDAAMIAWARRIEHYEMAAYSSAQTYALLLGLDQVLVLLTKSHAECEAADARLGSIAGEHLTESFESDALTGVAQDPGSR
jgi:ferritin-like metal-binding protein YciE